MLLPWSLGRYLANFGSSSVPLSIADEGERLLLPGVNDAPKPTSAGRGLDHREERLPSRRITPGGRGNERLHLRRRRPRLGRMSLYLPSQVSVVGTHSAVEREERFQRGSDGLGGVESGGLDQSISPGLGASNRGI